MKKKGLYSNFERSSKLQARIRKILKVFILKLIVIFKYHIEENLQISIRTNINIFSVHFFMIYPENISQCFYVDKVLPSISRVDPRCPPGKSLPLYKVDTNT